MPMQSIGKYIEVMKHAPEKGKKTCRWTVINKKGQYGLGDVAWSVAWRQYIFRPFPRTEWSAGCLEDVAKFLKAVREERV